MHESSRRRLMRLAFLLACIFPTTLIGGWSVLRTLPGNEAEMEESLRRDLGIIVRMDDVSYQKPFEFGCSGVLLIDPETRERIGSIPALQVRRTDRGYQLSMTRADVVTDQLPGLWRVIHDRILQQGILQGRAISMDCDRLTMQCNRGDHLLWDLRADVNETEGGPRIAASFRPEKERESGCNLLILRNRTTTPITTRVVFDSNSHRYPVRAMSEKLAALLGPSATFNGRIDATQTGDRWQGQLTNCKVETIDTSQLVANRLPHRLVGTGSIQLEHVKFDRGRIQYALGSILIRNGQISPSLVLSLGGRPEERKKLFTYGRAVTGDLAEMGDDEGIDIQSFAVGFQLNGFWVKLKGPCLKRMGDEDPSMQKDVLLVGRDEFQRATYLVDSLLPGEDNRGTDLYRRIQDYLGGPSSIVDPRGS